MTGITTKENPPAPPPTEKRADGFTLIEVMIALAFVAVLALAFGVTVSTADRTNIHAENWTAAYRAAQTVLEQTLSLDFATMKLQDGVQFAVTSTAPATTGNIQITDLGWEGQSGKAYQVTVTIPDYDVRLVTVRTVY